MMLQPSVIVLVPKPDGLDDQRQRGGLPDQTGRAAALRREEKRRRAAASRLLAGVLGAP